MLQVARNNAVYYNVLETRVRLSKRRARPGAAAQALTRLVVTHRPLTAPEHKMLRFREKELEPPQVSIVGLSKCRARPGVAAQIFTLAMVEILCYIVYFMC